MNLLAETLKELTSNDQSPDTVAWVGDRESKFAGSWDDFAAIADFEYDEGYGGQRIHDDLVVAFADGSWLERHEYDGSEWWEYKATPIRGGEALSSKKQLKYHVTY